MSNTDMDKRMEYYGFVQLSVAPEQRGIFIHIPKTAGSSTYLQTGTIAPRMFGRHATALFVKNRLSAEEWESLFKFAFIRNPWQRMVSMYRFYRNNGFTKLSDFKDWLIELNKTRKIEGNQYMDSLARNPITQKTFLTDENGDILVDYIGKLESFHHDFSIICNKLGIEPDKLHINQSKPYDYKKCYNSETESLIGNLCHWEISQFNYSFVS